MIYFTSTNAVGYSQDFTSDTKMMSTWIQSGAGVRRLVKGAPEILLNQCTKMLNNNGEVVDMQVENRQQLFELVDSMAKKGKFQTFLTKSI